MKLNVIWLPFDFKKIYTFPSALSYELFNFECQGLILSRRELGVPSQQLKQSERKSTGVCVVMVKAARA